MLTPGQVAHFETFGFLFLRQAFSRDEIEDVTREVEELLEKDRGGSPRAQEKQSISPFVELSPQLSLLAEDDRIYGTVEQLLGSGFIWAGSEGQLTGWSTLPHVGWHADRHGERELGYDRVKVMLYLDAVTANHGALRIIPGSHRKPMHMDLEVLHGLEAEDASPFGVDGPDMPGLVLESSPGDVVFFNHNLYHAMFNGWAGRRYIALKYASNPVGPRDVETLTHYATNVFSVHDSFLNSDSPRIRGMVDRLMAAAPKA